MNNYNPIKYSPTRLTSNYRPFKEIKNSITPRKYLVKDEGKFGFDSVVTLKANSLKTDTPIDYLLMKLYHDKFKNVFPAAYAPKETNVTRVVTRCFEASMHKDSSWGTKLFLSIVLHASKCGHCVFAMSPDITATDDAKASRLILKSGDIFLLDPLAIHSVHSTSQKKEELILLQYELDFLTRERTVQAMARSKYLYQNY